MNASSQTPRIKPPALRPGDTIGIVAPASNVDPAALAAGCERLAALGYKPFYFDSIFGKEIYFAGSTERRARELEEMFTRDDVHAIICARGGYGANYLPAVLNREKIARHPKIFCGYSDITTLLIFLSDTLGFVTFHAPMASKDFNHPDGVDLASWEAALTGHVQWELSLGADSGAAPLVEGSAEGILYGGCLPMLTASLGTPGEIQTEDTILFIEDVAAKPFQIDRMLMQLKLAGKLAKVRGLVFGEMLECVQHPQQGYILEEIVLRLVGDLRVPVAYGLRSGHVSRQNITLPIGVRAVLTVDSRVSLKILESSTTPAAITSSAAKS
jgi:muramoyltetrapeptide carboxypeptidase